METQGCIAVALGALMCSLRALSSALGNPPATTAAISVFVVAVTYPRRGRASRVLLELCELLVLVDCTPRPFGRLNYADSGGVRGEKARIIGFGYMLFDREAHESPCRSSS